MKKQQRKILKKKVNTTASNLITEKEIKLTELGIGELLETYTVNLKHYLVDEIFDFVILTFENDTSKMKMILTLDNLLELSSTAKIFADEVSDKYEIRRKKMMKNADIFNEIEKTEAKEKLFKEDFSQMNKEK